MRPGNTLILPYQLASAPRAPPVPALPLAPPPGIRLLNAGLAIPTRVSTGPCHGVGSLAAPRLCALFFGGIAAVHVDLLAGGGIYKHVPLLLVFLVFLARLFPRLAVGGDGWGRYRGHARGSRVRLGGPADVLRLFLVPCEIQRPPWALVLLP